ncbi:hypothetical protein SK128_025586 [Halocaridina rubra]|uniref:Spaetzle domain-containing protein n=1 Tax=Halocaridina rubra TaxID=373956 RepID=A0AAN9AG35_HALRR
MLFILFHIINTWLITSSGGASTSKTRGGNTVPTSWTPESPLRWPIYQHPWPDYPNPYRDDLLRLRDDKEAPGAFKSILRYPGSYGTRQDDFQSNDHRPKASQFPFASVEFPHIFIKPNHSLSDRVTHSYFSLGDHSKWRKKKKEGKKSSRDIKGSKVKGRHVTNVLAHPRKPKNYSAFVLGAPKYSLITPQIKNVTGTDALISESLRTGSHSPKKTKITTKSHTNYRGIKNEKTTFQDIEKRQQKNTKHLRLAKVVRTKIGKSLKLQTRLDIREHGRRSSAPHPGFFKDDTPGCALHVNRSYCFVDEKYPIEFMKKQLQQHKIMLEKLWRPYTPGAINKNPDQSLSLEIPNYTERTQWTHPKHRHAKSYKSQYGSKDPGNGYSCSSETDRRKLSQAKNTRGEWKMIVNVEGRERDNHLVQTTVLEECSGIGNSCDLLPKGLATSRCIQRHTIHNLLTWDPLIGFYVDSYSLPTACVCYVSHINLSLIKSYIED